MASLSNINGLFDVHSTGAILFSTSHGTSGQILKSNGNAAPTWVDASTVIGGPYLPLSGGTLTGNLAINGSNSLSVGGTLTGTSATFSGDLTVTGNQYFNGSFIEGGGKEMFKYSDAWLRINEDNDFTSGIYCGTGILRTDGQFEVGSAGTKFKVTSAGVVTALGNITAPSFNGLAINTTGTNNVANQIVRTDVNGYVNFGWINSISGATTSTITRITASNDAYLRYVTPATFRTQITDPYYAPAGTVSGVTSVATGNGLTGGTITTTGTLSLDRPNSALGAVLATYGTTAGSSGRIRCTAPFNTNTGKMFSIEITLYGSYTQHNYVVSAYMYSTTNQWHSPKAIYTTTGTTTPDIIVGRDANGKAYISIANANYTGVLVHNMTRGYQTSLADTYDPWTITVNAGTENSVGVSTSQVWTTANHTPGNYLPLAGGTMTNTNLVTNMNADLLDGQHGSYYFQTNITGNAATATTFNTGRTNYYNVTNNAVIGQMMWKNYGNNHTIFDASQSTSPSGSSVNNTNSNTAWSSSYPTLMGWNGSSTYGVRVDSARIADSATVASNYLPLAGGTVTGSTDFTAGTYPLDVYGIGSTASSSAVGLGIYGSSTAGAVSYTHLTLPTSDLV